MAAGVSEVRAAAAVAAVDLPWLLAGRVSVKGNAAVLDAGEGGVEFLVAEQERVMV